MAGKRIQTKGERLEAVSSRYDRPGPGRPPKEGWQEAFLKCYEEYGVKAVAARAAGVTTDLVDYRRDHDPDFAAQMKESYRVFIGNMEADLVQLGRRGNVIGTIARLKAEKPAKYHEKLQVEGQLRTVNVSVDLSGDGATKLLQRLLATITPETRKMLEGEVVEAETVDVKELPPSQVDEG